MCCRLDFFASARHTGVMILTLNVTQPSNGKVLEVLVWFVLLGEKFYGPRLTCVPTVCVCFFLSCVFFLLVFCQVWVV